MVPGFKNQKSEKKFETKNIYFFLNFLNKISFNNYNEKHFLSQYKNLIKIFIFILIFLNKTFFTNQK